MAEQVTNYKCPACTGPLHFAGASGMLECEYCGSMYEVSDMEQLYAAKEKQAADAFSKETDEKKSSSEGSVFDDINEHNANWNDDSIEHNWGLEDGMRSYSCPSCGAELICDETTAATSCPYCGNPTIIPGQFSGELKPNYIIPFKLDKNAAKEALKRHYKGKILLPKTFSNDNHIEEVKGIYVPFWLFSAQAKANISYTATRTHVYRSGDYEVTRTDHYAVSRSGSASFDKIPTDASRKMPDDYMDSIEPFDYNELKEFSSAYMPGYLADKYDVSIDESKERADIRCENSIAELLRNDITGYNTVVERGRKIGLKRGEVKYALLPVWILNTRWNNTNYMFVVNGQTGKIVGDLPVDKKKLNLIRTGVFAGVTILSGLVGIGGMIASLFT